MATRLQSWPIMGRVAELGRSGVGSYSAKGEHMQLEVTCPACGTLFHVPDYLANRPALCPHCGHAQTVNGTVVVPPRAPDSAVGSSERGTWHEFSEPQSREFRNAAYWMGIMGRSTILLGILMCLGFFAILNSDTLPRGPHRYSQTFRIDYLAGGVISIVIGAWTLIAANSFRRASEVSGRDIEKVVDAVVNLKRLFRLQAVVVGISAIMFIITLTLVGVVAIFVHGGAR